MLSTALRLVAGLLAAAALGYAVGLVRNRSGRSASRYTAPRPPAASWP